MQPLALIYYQNLLPGSTLANRLRDLNYRVHAAGNLAELVSVAQSEGPMVVLMDVTGEGEEAFDSLRKLRSDSRTTHVPILAFTDAEPRQEAARAAGATLAASDAAMNSHFEQLLEQVLRLD
jgi:DNA-binding response OmpR family regulator